MEYREAGGYMYQNTTLYSINLYNYYVSNIKHKEINFEGTTTVGMTEVATCSPIFTNSLTLSSIQEQVIHK